jgi:nicotinate-nucleotide adenylyltransferase
MEGHRPKRVGLFGGTFDPVHKGHIASAKSFLNSKYIESLWILLNPAPPHKQEENFAPYADRLQMLRGAFRPVQNIKISDIETRLPKPCYTVQTIRYLKDHYPGVKFYLCIGYDSYVEFQEWYQWKQILDYCTLLVADRPDIEPQKEDQKLTNNAIFVEHQSVRASSTVIRENITEGKPIDDMVPESVATFIKENDLYKS